MTFITDEEIEKFAYAWLSCTAPGLPSDISSFKAGVRWALAREAAEVEELVKFIESLNCNCNMPQLTEHLPRCWIRKVIKVTKAYRERRKSR